MNKKFRMGAVFCQALACFVPVASAQDKSGYTLFDPTPRELMREMSTDRPDTTESPYTVDAGRFQVEISLVDYTRNDDVGERTDRVSILPTNLKIGLLNNVDIQFVLTPYVRQQSNLDDDAKGFGDDTQIRLKINVWGNDVADPAPGATAMAVMPFVKFPTGAGDLTHDHVEGGVILPLAVALPGGFGLGLMAEFDLVYNEAEEDYGIEFVHTATISYDIPGVENLGAFVEYIGIAPYDTGTTYQAACSAGLTYALSGDWVLDFGGTVGLSDDADDFTLFVGTSFRL